MESIRIDRSDIVKMIREKYEAEGYHIVRIFPHTSGYVVDVVKEDQ